MWLLYAAVGPAIWAFLNHLDKYLPDRFLGHGSVSGTIDRAISMRQHSVLLF